MNSLLEYYHHLHCFPELSGQEQETSRYVTEVLRSLGYDPRPIGTYGVYADLISGPDAPWILFRADMDALPIEEAEGHSLRSQNPGVMHACGHDTHTSMLLAAARELKQASAPLPQNVRFLFQPSEENVRGAREMIEAGVMEPRFSAAFAMHVWPQVPRGTLQMKPGAMMASSDIFRITCRGRGVHCAQRASGADALQAAVRITARMPELEKLAEGDGTMLFCGSIHSGTAHNVVSDSAVIEGTLRSYSEPHRQTIKKALEDTCEACGQALHVQVKLQWSAACPVLMNDPDLAARLQKVLPWLTADAKPSLAAEDFAYYQQDCPGVLMWLGAGDIPPLHSKDIVIPEEILPLGVKTWVRLANTDWGDEDMQRKRNPEYSRQIILEAAEAEFSEKGLPGARVDRIAQRAGINKRMIYAYFGDKETLYKVILARAYERMASIEAPLMEAGFEGRELIEQIISLYFDFLLHDPHFVSLLMWENLNHGTYLAEIEDSRIRRSTIPYFIDKLEEGKRKGLIRPEIDSKQSVISLITSCFSNFSNQYTLSKLFGEKLCTPESMEQRKQHTIQILTAYLCL